MEESRDDKTTMKNEREFLHDLCNPLSIAYGQLHLLVAKIKPGQDNHINEKMIEKLDKIMTHLEKTNSLISERRSELINSSND